MNSKAHVGGNAQRQIFYRIYIVVSIKSIVGIDDIFLVEEIPDWSSNKGGCFRA